MALKGTFSRRRFASKIIDQNAVEPEELTDLSKSI